MGVKIFILVTERKVRETPIGFDSPQNLLLLVAEYMFLSRSRRALANVDHMQR